MKKLYLILLNVLIFTSLFSQNDYQNQGKDTSFLFQKKIYPDINKYDNRIHLHLSTGANVTSFGNNTVFTKWIAPGFSYVVNSKLNIYFGTLVLNGNPDYQSFNNEHINNGRSNSTQAFLYLSGDYQLNKSIRLRATTFNDMQSKNSLNNSYNYNQIGVDIKVNDYFFISADFISEKGIRPFGMYNNSMFNESNSTFGNGFLNYGHLNSFH